MGIVSKISLVTFDVTNTLIRLKNPIGVEYLKVVQLYSKNVLKRGFSRDECQNDLTKAFKSVWKDMNKEHKNYGIDSGMSSLEWWSQTVIKTFRAANYGQNLIDDTQMDLISKHLFRHYSSGNCWAADYKSHEMLSQLRNSHKDLKIGVISNNDERLDRILQELVLRHFFDFVLTSRIAKHCKPSKEIFDMALQSAQLSDPTRALHVGNDLQLDYLAAKSFGWNGLLFANIADLSAQDLDKVNQNEFISDLIQLHTKLQ